MTSHSVFQDQRVQDFTPRVTLSMCSARRVSPDPPIVEHVVLVSQRGGSPPEKSTSFPPRVLCYCLFNHPLCQIRILKEILPSEVFWTGTVYRNTSAAWISTATYSFFTHAHLRNISNHSKRTRSAGLIIWCGWKFTDACQLFWGCKHGDRECKWQICIQNMHAELSRMQMSFFKCTVQTKGSTSIIILQQHNTSVTWQKKTRGGGQNEANEEIYCTS